MGARTLGPIPQAMLLHRVSDEAVDKWSIKRSTKEFEAFSARWARPPAGYEMFDASCQRCYRPLTFRIWSIAATRRRRCVRLGLAALGPLLAPALILGSGEEWSVSRVFLVLTLGGLLVGVTIAGLVSWWREDGLRLAHGRPVPPIFPSINRHFIGFPIVGDWVTTRPAPWLSRTDPAERESGTAAT